jgi:TRAP-type C4-dicarboxylate transport system permease small subunit
MLSKIEHILALVLDGVITLFFGVILLLTIIQVFLRYGFNSSLLGANETMEGLFIYTTALGAAAALRRRKHININFVETLLPPLMRRVADIVVHLLVAFLNGVMIYYSIGWIRMVGDNESPVMRIPEWTYQVSIPVGCGLVVCYCLVNIAMNISGNWTEPEDQSC